MHKILVTHPTTGEALCKKEWAAKLGITPPIFSIRLKNHPLAIALTPGKLPTGRDVWSPEEEAYLIDIHRTPNLYKRWNRLAKIRGWKPRSQYALSGHLNLLKKEGAIDGRQNLDESAGWLSLNQLRHCLCISEDPVKIWFREGLKVTRDGVSYRIHLKDFVAWACTIEGAALVAKAVNGNAIALNWLLVQIGNWGIK